MSLALQIQTGLKEWASVCNALRDGRQCMLLRKGGISETAGEFTVEHAQFLLFPTYLHQKLSNLKPEFRAGFEERSDEPGEVHLAVAGVVTDIIQLQTRGQMDLIDDLHVWMPPLIDMRFNYRPENPLYLMLVRAYQLQQPITIQNTPAYAGCKSWVPLDKPVDTQNAKPAMSDVAYKNTREKISQLLQVV